MTTENATETKFLVTTTVPGFVTAAEIISQLRAEYDGVTYDVSTPLGMAKAVAARKKLRDARIALDKKKPEVKREALDFCNKVELDYKTLRAAVMEYEDIPDAAIKAEEERKEAIKEQQRIEAAAAQKILDDKIIEIGKLPLRCIDMTSDEITFFVAKLDTTPIGGEFTGDTRKRAEEAKEESITAIRGMLAAKIKAEEIAAALKVEQEAEAAKLEVERVEREAADKIRREECERIQAEENERHRIAAENMARETKRLNDERAVFEAEKAQVSKKQAEDDRIAAAKQAKIDAENKRVQDEADAKQREVDRHAAALAEQKRIESEKARKAAEKKAKLLAARCDNAEVALVKILDLCREDESGNTTLAEIALIAEASI